MSEPRRPADALAIYRTLWRAHVTPRIPQLLYPGVRPGLEELRQAGPQGHPPGRARRVSANRA